MTETTSASPQEEQRANARTKLTVEVRVDSESQFFAGISGNVSKGGIFVATYALLPIGTPVLLEFTLPTSPERPIVANGTVRWVRETEAIVHGMGVTFDGLEKADAETIRSFCEVRAPLFHDAHDAGRDRASDPSIQMWIGRPSGA